MNIYSNALAVEIEVTHGSKNIYGFTLYNDEGAMRICPSTNTQVYLETKPKQDYEYDRKELKEMKIFIYKSIWIR